MVPSIRYTMHESLATLAGLHEKTAGVPPEVLQALYPEVFLPALLKLDTRMPIPISESPEAQRFAIAVVADALFDDLVASASTAKTKRRMPESLEVLRSLYKDEKVQYFSDMLDGSPRLDGVVRQNQKVMNSFRYYVNVMDESSSNNSNNSFWKNRPVLNSVLAGLWSFTGRELLRGPGVTELQEELRGTMVKMIEQHEVSARRNAQLYFTRE